MREEVGWRRWFLPRWPADVSDRLISFLEICAFPPIRNKKANGWGTGLIQNHTVRDLVD
jgi:hypothetical protein